MRKSLSRRDLARYGFEALLIVFSVLLALWLDELRQERRENAYLSANLEQIASEMRNNLGIVERLLPYHRSIVAELDRHIASAGLREGLRGEQGIEYMRLMPNGLIQEFYSVTAWDLARQGGVTTRLDFETGYAISRAYSSQAFVDNTIRSLFEFLLGPDAVAPADLRTSTIVLRNRMAELVGQENALKLNYEAALAAIGEG